MEQCYFLNAYLKKRKFKTKRGDAIWFKSRVVELDAFIGTGDAQQDLNTAFNRAEDHPLFRAGWRVVCLKLKDFEFREKSEELIGEVIK